MMPSPETRSSENQKLQVQNNDKQHSQSKENKESAQRSQESQPEIKEKSGKRNQGSQQASKEESVQRNQGSQQASKEESVQRNQDSQQASKEESVQRNQGSQQTSKEESVQRNEGSQPARKEEYVQQYQGSYLHFQQPYQGQPPLRYPNATEAHQQPPMYVLPYGYPAYTAPAYDAQQYPPPEYTSQNHSAQLGQPNEKQPMQTRSSNEQTVQSRTTYEDPVQRRPSNRQPGQPDQNAQPSNYGQQSYPQQHPQNVVYVHPYTAQPPSAKGTPMVRPGRGFRDRDEPEQELSGWETFENSKIRRTFVRKVYIILMLQLLCSLAVIALFVFEPNVKRFVRSNIYLFYISLAIFLAVYLGMACFESVRRKYPTNIIVLVVFTLAASYMLGTISSTYNTEAVFMAVGICAAVCFAVSIFSFYTKFDFTKCGGILCILLVVLILFGLIAIFIPSRVMTMIYAGSGAIIFTLFLAYDTQMLMGGKKYELSPEEHIFAAVQLYVDVINIFLFLLMLLGNKE